MWRGPDDVPAGRRAGGGRGKGEGEGKGEGPTILVAGSSWDSVVHVCVCVCVCVYLYVCMYVSGMPQQHVRRITRYYRVSPLRLCPQAGAALIGNFPCHAWALRCAETACQQGVERRGRWG